MMMIVTPNNNNRRQLALHRDGLLADCLLTGSASDSRSRRSLLAEEQRLFVFAWLFVFASAKMAQEKREKRNEEQSPKPPDAHQQKTPTASSPERQHRTRVNIGGFGLLTASSSSWIVG